MSKKDILFLCQFFYPEHNSSATLPFDTAEYLAAHGFAVDALCGYPKEYNDRGEVPLKETVSGVNIHRIRYIQLGRKQTISRLVNYFSFTFSAFLRLFKLKNYKCVIVYSNPPVLPFLPVVANKLFGTKLVFVAYDVYPEVAYASNTLHPGDLIDRVMKRLNRSIYRRASMIVALTDEMKAFLLANRPQLTTDRVTTIANWAHEKSLVPNAEAYKRFGYKKNQFLVSYFGNMGTCQDVETMMGAIEALKDNDTIRFLMIGHGNKKEAIKQRIMDKNLKNLQLIDFLTGTDFEQAVSISTCCLVSLERGLKGTCAPSKYYSYLQGGQPVFAIVEKGSYLEKEIEGERIGKVIELGDSVTLAKELCTLERDPLECRNMGTRARELYQREYTMEIALAKYEKVFTRTI